MSGIRVVTDSASDLDEARARALGVVVVPLEVRLGTGSGSSLTGVSPEEFWQLANGSDVLAETAAPAPGAFAAVFAKAAEEGCDGVVCINLSSELSATYQSARTATAGLPGGPAVEVVDSRLATMGEGIVVLAAAEAAAAGGDLAAVTAAARGAIGRVGVLGTLDTLEYLRRGGRIGSAQALIGSLLSIKPVIEVRDGRVEGESRQRTRGRSLEYLAEKLRALGPLRRLAVVHAAARDVDAFVSLIADVETEEPLTVGFIGPVIGAHTGPGTVGVCFERAVGA